MSKRRIFLITRDRFLALSVSCERTFRCSCFTAQRLLQSSSSASCARSGRPRKTPGSMSASSPSSPTGASASPLESGTGPPSGLGCSSPRLPPLGLAARLEAAAAGEADASPSAASMAPGRESLPALLRCLQRSSPPWASQLALVALSYCYVRELARIPFSHEEAHNAVPLPPVAAVEHLALLSTHIAS